MKFRIFNKKLSEKIFRLPKFYVEFVRKYDVQNNKFNAKIWLDRITANMPDHLEEGYSDL